MKAVKITGYGAPEVLQLGEAPKPEPKANELLIRVRASSVSAADTMMRKGTPRYARLFLGVRRPKNPIPGTVFAGEIEAIGSDVTQFRVGDAVFGESGIGFSAHAEYFCMSEDGVIALKPEQMSFEEAAPACDGAVTSLNFLRELANVQAGQRVLINGAAGGLGTAAIQLAKHFGAEVTAVCSGRNAGMVRELGADHVIDYTQEDFTKNGQSYDVIYDTVGKRSYRESKGALTRNGIYMSPVLSMPLLLQMLWTSKIGSKRAKFSATGLLPAPVLRGMLGDIKALYEAKVVTTIIDRSYPFEEIVEAHRHVDTGHKRGNVVLSLGAESPD